MRRLLFVGMNLLSLATFADERQLTFPIAGVRAVVSWETPLRTDAPAQIQVQLLSLKSGEPVLYPHGFIAELVMDLPGHSHGSMPIRPRMIRDGVYQLDRAYLTMRGEWQLRISLPLAGHTREIQTVVMTVP